MISVPFIYFSILLYLIYMKNGKRIDIAFYILSIYWISAFFSILIDVFDLYSRTLGGYRVTSGATFAYCGLITLCLLPFIFFSSNRIVEIRKIKNPNFLKFLSKITFAYFVIYLIISLPLLYRVLTGNIGEIRADHYAGYNDEDTVLTSLPFIIRLPFTFFNLFTGCPWILIFLGFYSLVIQKLPMKYSVLFFMASLIGIIQNISQAGRSDTVYWLISFGACYIFFLPFFSKSLIKKIRKFLIFLVAIFALYLLMSTISRFSDSSEGTEGGLISYAGFSYINFCYFYDTFRCPIPSLEIIMPFTYYVLGLSSGSIVEFQRTLSWITGEELGTFYTFMGQIAVTTSNQIMIAYCILLVVLSFAFVYRIHKGKVKLLACFFYLVFSSVLFLGLFSHFYGLPSKTFSVITFAFIFARLRSVNKSTLINRLEEK